MKQLHNKRNIYQQKKIDKVARDEDEDGDIRLPWPDKEASTTPNFADEWRVWFLIFVLTIVNSFDNKHDYLVLIAIWTFKKKSNTEHILNVYVIEST